MGAKPAHRGQLSDNYSCSRNTERVLSCLHDLVLLTPAASLLQPPEFLQQTQEGLGCQLTGAVRCAVLGDAYLTPKFSLHPCDYSMLDSARKKKKMKRPNKFTSWASLCPPVAKANHVIYGDGRPFYSACTVMKLCL